MVMLIMIMIMTIIQVLKYYIGSVVDHDDDNNIQFDILKGHIGTVYDENYYDGEDEQDHETSYTLQIHLLKHFNFVF